jgi:hypothetical protein
MQKAKPGNIAGRFPSLSAIDRPSQQKISKNIEDLNNTINHFDLTGVLKYSKN